MNLDREYEKYRGGPTQAKSDRIYATITGRGAIFLNAKLYAMIGKPPAVYLYFNRAKDRIVIEPTNPRFSEAFPVRQSQQGYKIYAAPFCGHFGIKLQGTHKFVSPEPQADGKLMLDLSNMVRIEFAKRKKRQTAE